MDRSEIKALPRPIESKTYYVEDDHDRWGFFTVTPAIGLLHIYSDYGNYNYRWSAPGPDFVAFLLGLNDHYLGGCLSSCDGSSERRVENLLKHLWPLFIEILKAELAGEEVKPT